MYLYLITFILLLCFFLKDFKDQNKAKRIMIYINTFLLCLISAIKHMGVGNDVFQYYLSFNYADHFSWNTIFGDIYSYIDGSRIISDPVYGIIEKGFHYISDSFYVYSFFVCLVLVSAIGKLLYIGVNSVLGCSIGYIYYITMFFYNIPNNLYRQTIAMGILLWIVILLINNPKKIIIPLILLFTGTLVHKSCLLGIIPIAFIYMKNTKYIYLSAIVLSPLVFVFGRLITLFLIEIANNERYEGYADFDNEAQPIAYILQMIILYFLGFLIYKKIPKMTTIHWISCACFAMSITTVTFLLLSPDLIRITYYFSIWGIIFLPMCFELCDKKFKTICLIVILGLLIGRTTLRPPIYKFYWEQMELHDRYYK